MRDVSLPHLERRKKKALQRNIKSIASGISYTKRKKNSVRCNARDLNLGPLVYEAILSDENLR